MSEKTAMEHITEVLFSPKESFPPDYIVNDDITEHENEKIRKMAKELGHKYRTDFNATHLK